MTDKKPTLAELCTESIKLILHLRSTQDYGDAVLLRRRINDLLSVLEGEARGIGVDSADINMTKLALVVFLDETISKSQWSQKEKGSWMAKPLQLEQFKIFNGGEVFFERLNQLRGNLQRYEQTLEVYLLCLMLGFKGKYFLDTDKLRAVTEEVYRELYGASRPQRVILSPRGHLEDDDAPKKKAKIPIWSIPVAATLIALIFYFFMSSSLSDTASTISGSLSGEPSQGAVQ